MTTKKTIVCYCVHCRSNSKMDHIEVKQTKRGGFMVLGKCVTCHKKVAKMISKDEAKKLQQSKD